MVRARAVLKVLLGVYPSSRMEFVSSRWVPSLQVRILGMCRWDRVRRGGDLFRRCLR